MGVLRGYWSGTHSKVRMRMTVKIRGGAAPARSNESDGPYCSHSAKRGGEMPQLSRVLTQEDMQCGASASRMDLTEYIGMIDRVRRENGVGGEVALGDDESRRAEKRRLSIAAKQSGMTLTWRKSPDGTLRFVLAEQGKEAPGSR